MDNFLAVKLRQVRETCRVLRGRLMSPQRVFDLIYKNRTWAHKPGMLSGTGSYGKWSESYIAFIAEFISTHHIRSISDVGCGDFNIGRQICPLVESYQALDVSGEIIRMNQYRYCGLRNVTFRRADACKDPLPTADLITVRQVFQHLRNNQIEAILHNIERSNCSYVLVSEHLPTQDYLIRPNVDLPCHGANTRLEQSSGVMLQLPPFSRAVTPVLRIPAEDGAEEELVIFLWKPSAQSCAPKT